MVILKDSRRNVDLSEGKVGLFGSSTSHSPTLSVDTARAAGMIRCEIDGWMVV